jgi:hypothetical protein
MTRRPGLRTPREPLAAAATAVIVLVTVSPWALGFSASHSAVAEHIAFAMGFAPLAVLICALPAAAVSVVLAGGWLVASPWLLGYWSMGVGAWGADLLGGVALVTLSAAALRAADASRTHAAPAITDAGQT